MRGTIVWMRPDTGHTELTWDTEVAETVEEAETFLREIRRTHLVFDPATKTQMTTFDPAVSEYVISDRFVGG